VCYGPGMRACRSLVAAVLSAALVLPGCAHKRPPEPARVVTVEPEPARRDTARPREAVRRAAPEPAPALSPAALAARDTAAASRVLRRCAGHKLLPEQENTRDATLDMIAQARTALLRGDGTRARSLARTARQLAESLSCR